MKIRGRFPLPKEYKKLFLEEYEYTTQRNHFAKLLVSPGVRAFLAGTIYGLAFGFILGVLIG